MLPTIHRYLQHSGVEKHMQANYHCAFLRLIAEIEHNLVEGGKAYDMATLLSMYERHLMECGIEKAIVDVYKALKIALQ